MDKKTAAIICMSYYPSEGVFTPQDNPVIGFDLIDEIC